LMPCHSHPPDKRDSLRHFGFLGAALGSLDWTNANASVRCLQAKGSCMRSCPVMERGMDPVVGVGLLLWKFLAMHLILPVAFMQPACPMPTRRVSNPPDPR